MSAASTLLLGAVLTFAESDGRTLALTVALTQPATVSLDWAGAVRTATIPASRHRFTALPSPREVPLDYTLAIAGEAPVGYSVKPLFGEGPLRVALYGDSRDGPGPHQELVAAIAAADPHLVVHTGDVVHSALDEEGWVRHLATSLPLTARVPTILALGNHELWQPRDLPAEQRVDALAQVMRFLPPPADPSPREGVPASVHAVRVGPALFVALDSNVALGAGSPQLAWLEARLSAEAPRAFTFLALHHGPRSSGPHGGHPEGDELVALAKRHGVTAILAGHDHTYERVVEGSVTCVVSGGGGAPLYPRTRPVAGSQAFASTYNWVLLTLEGERGTLEARSLEGVVLDRGALPASEVAPRVEAGRNLVALGLLLGALTFALFRGLRARRRG
jgi:hypothetical protein